MERGTKRFKGVGKPTTAARARLANAKARIQRIPVQLARTGGRMPQSGELKNNDVLVATPLVTFGSTAGQLQLMNGISQGTSATTRIGRRVMIKSIYLRYWCTTASNTTGSTPIRLMIVFDKQSNTVAPTAAEVLVADSIVSPNNLSNSRRFVTLMDKMLQLDTAGPNSANLEFYKKCNLEVQYNTVNGGAIGDIQTGSLYLFVWSNGTLGTASPTGNVYTRIRFED